MREEGSGTRKEAEKQLKKSGVEIGRLNIVASMENQEAIKKSVSNGMGMRSFFQTCGRRNCRRSNFGISTYKRRWKERHQRCV